MLRGGDVVGEHSVIFYGESERGNFTSSNRPSYFRTGRFVQHDLPYRQFWILRYDGCAERLTMPKKMKLNAVDACFERLSLRQPDPQTELDLPAIHPACCCLSAQATDVGSIRRQMVCLQLLILLQRWWRSVLRPYAIIFALLVYLTQRLKMYLLCRKFWLKPMVAKFQKIVSIRALPGVGRKTANVVLNEAFGEPTIAVDTHIFVLATAPV